MPFRAPGMSKIESFIVVGSIWTRLHAWTSTFLPFWEEFYVLPLFLHFLGWDRMGWDGGVMGTGWGWGWVGACFSFSLFLFPELGLPRGFLYSNLKAGTAGGPRGFPGSGPRVPPASGAQFPQPQEPSSSSLRSATNTKNQKWKTNKQTPTTNKKKQKQHTNN